MIAAAVAGRRRAAANGCLRSAIGAVASPSCRYCVLRSRCCSALAVCNAHSPWRISSALHQSAGGPVRCNQGPLVQRQGWTAACALTMLYMELRQQASRNPAVPFCSPSNRPGFGSLKTKLYDLVWSLPLYPSRIKKDPFPLLRRLEASGRWSLGLDICTGQPLPTFTPSDHGHTLMSAKRR